MKLRRRKRKRSAARTFETEFALEILKSDRLRVTILICAFAAVVPVTLALAVFVYEDFQRIFHGNFKSFLLALLTVMTVCLGCLTSSRRNTLKGSRCGKRCLMRASCVCVRC